MDALIRGAHVSDRAVILGVRRPALPPEAAPAAKPLPAGPHAVEATPAAPSAPDAAWLEAERKKIGEELRRELDARLESAAAEARAQGYEQGVEQGKAESLRETREQRTAVGRALAAIAERAEGEIAGLHDLIVGIAFEAVCKVLGGRVLERDAVASMVSEIVSRVKQEETIVVRLHPRDCTLLRELADETGEPRHLNVELAADEKIALGGCIVETEGGLLDARIETQMQRLREALLRARSATGPGPSASSES